MSNSTILTTTGKPRAFPFIRWSSDPQTWGDSERRQNRLADDYCAREGLEIQEPAIAKGVSGWKGQQRAEGSAFANLLTKVRTGDYILIESNHRFSREDAITALTALKDIVSSGVTIVFLDTGLKVTKDNFNKMEVILPNFLKALLANMEIEQKSTMVQSGWKKLKEEAVKGVIMTKCLPAWLTCDYETNTWGTVKPHIDTIKRIFAEYVAGEGIRTIMRRLNREKVPTFGKGKQNKGKWSNTHLRRLLESRNVLGEYQPHKYVPDPTLKTKRKTKRVTDGQPIPNYYPQVIEPAIFYKAKEILEKNGHPSGRKDYATNLFTGFIRCEKCGGSLVIKRDKCRGYNYVSLRCSNGSGDSTKCGWSSIQYEWVERAVLTLLWSKVVPLMAERDNGRDELFAKQGEHKHTIEQLKLCKEKLDAYPSDTLFAHIHKLETKSKALVLEIESLTARLDNNPLASWTHVPKTKENRLKLQAILASEIESITLNVENSTGTLKVKDPECEFDLKWKRSTGDPKVPHGKQFFESMGKEYYYQDDYFVWKTDKNIDLSKANIIYDEPLKEAA